MAVFSAFSSEKTDLTREIKITEPQKISAPLSAGIISAGFAGMQAQALGLAAYLGASVRNYPIKRLFPWNKIPLRFAPNILKAIEADFSPPEPDLFISCGTTGAAVAAAWHKKGKRTVQIQHPRLNPQHFDLIVVNPHDRLTGENVLISRTALHRITPELLADTALQWQAQFAAFPRPFIGVSLGGSNKRFAFTAEAAENTARNLTRLAASSQGTLLVTPSRRTDPEAKAILRKAVLQTGGYFWDEKTPNPYLGILALADLMAVTVDSVSMLSEAAATTAPLRILPLPGSSKRINAFAQSLIDLNRASFLTDKSDFTQQKAEPLNDTPFIAAEVKKRLFGI